MFLKLSAVILPENAFRKLKRQRCKHLRAFREPRRLVQKTQNPLDGVGFEQAQDQPAHIVALAVDDLQRERIEQAVARRVGDGERVTVVDQRLDDCSGVPLDAVEAAIRKGVDQPAARADGRMRSPNRR